MSVDKKKNFFSRRGFLGSGLLLPFLVKTTTGVTQTTIKKSETDDDYITMLTAKGDVVRVRKNALKKVKIVKQHMSNKSLFSWLKLKV